MASEIPNRFKRFINDDFIKKLKINLEDMHFDADTIEQWKDIQNKYEWTEAFEKTCNDVSASDMSEYYSKLDWIQRELFDDEIIEYYKDFCERAESDNG